MTRAGPPKPRWRIDDVLARTDLARLLDEVAQPATQNVRGRRWHCPLPEHDDRHPSVTMHVDHRGHERWRCWSGDDTHRGDAIDLAAATQRLSRGAAIDWLAERAGMIPGHALAAPARRPRPAAPKVVPLHPSVPAYAAACEQILWGRNGQAVLDWLQNRGFEESTLLANHVGADPGRQLLGRRRGLPYGQSVAAVFPVLNPAGSIRYVQARYLEPGDGPKYDNPAAALGSNPRLAWTRTAAPPHAGVLVVCEGIPDALTAAQGGYTAVGVLGSQAPDHRVAARLATHADRHQLIVVAVIDNDPAGRSWGQRLGDLLAEHDHDLTIVEPPGEGLDLNAWALNNSDWADQLGRAVTTPMAYPAEAIRGVSSGVALS